MNNTYLDLVKQTFNFPQEGFNVKDNYLEFNGIDLQALIAKYGTPLKLTYLPKIGMQIRKAKKMFATAIAPSASASEMRTYITARRSSHASASASNVTITPAPMVISFLVMALSVMQPGPAARLDRW